MTRPTYHGITLRHRPIFFSSPEAAARSLSLGNYAKPMMIVLGEDADVMLVVMSDAQRLARAGYSIARA